MTIHCKLHKLLEVIPPSLLALDLRADPMFIFSDEVCETLLRSDAAQASFKAMAELGLCHLPYPKMTCQFKGTQKASQYTWFISLREVDGKFFARDSWYNASNGHAGTCEGGTDIVADAKFFKCETSGQKVNAEASAVGIQLAVLMTQINGLEREHVEPPERLNAKREASGKPRVKSYSYIRVGHIYDSSGTRHERSSATGRVMPIHMRAGHIRNQAYGPERAERRPTWIPPVLVNYKPGDQEKPILEKRVVV